MQPSRDIIDFFQTNTQLEGYPTKHVCIIICDPSLSWDENDVASTWQSMYRWRQKNSDRSIDHVKNNIRISTDIDSALESTDHYTHACIAYAGTRCRSYYIKERFERFKNDNIALEALFLWNNEDNTHYPSMQKKMIFINLDHWREAGRPSFSKYTGPATPLADYMVGEMGITSSVTTDKKIYLEEKLAAKVISSFVEKGCKVVSFFDDNIPYERNVTTYQDNTLYLYNNQLLRPRTKTNVKHIFDVIYAPAAGAMSEFLWREYGAAHTKLIIYDVHYPSLEWKRTCYSAATSFYDIQNAAMYISKQYGCDIDVCEYKQHVVDLNKITFPLNEWADTFSQIGEVEFEHTNIITDPILNIDPNKKTLIYTSNIFEYNPRILHISIRDVDKKFRQYARLPNVLLYGQNVFNDSFYVDNIE